jgi:photosystem II stability/assembly factor-like uncharacterized protein
VLLRSGNGGGRWDMVTAGGATLRAVAITTDRTLAVAVGDGGTVLRSTDAGLSFAKVAGAPTVNLRAVRFSSDASLGVIVGDGGTVLISRDRGQTWRAGSSAPSALNGVSVKNSRIIAVGDSGLIWRSTDGGATFNQVAAGSALRLSAIGFEEDHAESGWAVGDHGTILHTVDGGAHFSPLPSPTDVDFTAVEDF